jgi:hypothetical protein
MQTFTRTILALLFMQIIFYEKIYAEICTPLAKQTKYVIRSGEDFYSILKNFGLEPVNGDGGSLELLQKANNRQGETVSEVGSEIILPFKCEENLVGWRIIDKGAYRLITSERVDKTSSTDSKKVKSENIGEDKRTDAILNKDLPGASEVDLDEVNNPSEEVSDALRYRMICDGEWTGTECITRYSTIYAIGGAWYNRYDGTDNTTGGQGILLSKLNPEVGLGWNNYWTENFRTDLSFSIINNDIHPEVRERPIEQSKKTLNTFVADARFEVGKWGFSGGLAQRERLFYRFIVQNIVLFDDGGVVVNAVPLMDYHAGVSYMIHQTGKFRFDAELGYVSILGASTSGYNVTPGSAFDIGFTVQHDRIKEYLFATVKYEVSQQDTDILLQKATELGFRFGYAWKLKDW